jgi:hypothetical protein
MADVARALGVNATVLRHWQDPVKVVTTRKPGTGSLHHSGWGTEYA